MIGNPVAGSLQPLDFVHTVKEVPELQRFDCNIDSLIPDPILDSSNIRPQNWAQLVELIESSHGDYDGFVILHGTDTMVYSASALSFLSEGLGKPVFACYC